MAVSEKQTVENKATINGSGAEPPRPEANEVAESDVQSTGTAKNETPAGGPKKRKAVFRWAALLLALALAVVGYLQRERLLKLIPSRNASQSSTLEEATTVKANLPEGAFQITPEKQQLIGVKYAEVEYKPVSRTLRAVGRLTFDETKIVRIHPKIEGWIEQVSVDFIGKLVQKGQPLISLYSPELLQTQQEFLLARRGRDELSQSPFREAVNASESLYQAARKRLELWDITEEQISELEKSGKPSKTLTIYAPTDGFVLTRNAFTRQRVTPDTELYTIADLSTIWVITDIYEYEAPEIKVGQSAIVTLSYSPGRTYRGKVTYIYPQLDNTTRTLKARVEVANPGFNLKPDMFANVDLEIGYGSRVVVPQEAVMDSGAEQLVFVAHEGGYFEPRKVQLGAKVDNEFIVLGGLKAGERIVTSANFLIDSESKLKAAAGGMGMPGMNHVGGQGGVSKAPATNAPATGKPSLPPKQEDHSQHQRGASATPQSKPDGHSQHQLKQPQE